jgi:hypothetical protein
MARRCHVLLAIESPARTIHTKVEKQTILRTVALSAGFSDNRLWS